MDPNLAALQCRIHQGVAISALDAATLPPLIARLEAKVEEVLSQADLRRPLMEIRDAIME